MTGQNHSSPLMVSRGALNSYRAKLNASYTKMAKEAYREISKAYADGESAESLNALITELQSKWLKEFSTDGDLASQKMIADTLRHSSATVKNSLAEISALPEKKREFVLPKYAYARSESEEEKKENPILWAFLLLPLAYQKSEKIKETVAAARMENNSLISNICNAFFENCKGIVARNIQSGGNLKQVKSEINNQAQIGQRRVFNVAEDQVYKANASISAALAQENGVKKFRWVHTYTGNRPRLYHKNDLNGKVFEYDNPPIIDPKTGIRGLPGQLPYCRCIAELVGE